MSLEKALEHAAEHLPQGWTIHFSVENGSGWVRAERPDGTMVEMHEDETVFEEQVRNAVRLAHNEIAADALSEENVKVHTSATGSAASTQVDGCSHPEKTNSERVADCGVTAYCASSFSSEDADTTRHNAELLGVDPERFMEVVENAALVAEVTSEEAEACSQPPSQSP